MLNNLGVLNADDQHGAEARKDFDEALYYRALAAQHPDVHRTDLARTLINLGNLNRAAEARENYEEALTIYRQFAARAPAIHQQRVQGVEQSLRDLDLVNP